MFSNIFCLCLLVVNVKPQNTSSGGFDYGTFDYGDYEVSEEFFNYDNRSIIVDEQSEEIVPTTTTSSFVQSVISTENTYNVTDPWDISADSVDTSFVDNMTEFDTTTTTKALTSTKKGTLVKTKKTTLTTSSPMDVTESAQITSSKIKPTTSKTDTVFTSTVETTTIKTISTTESNSDSLKFSSFNLNNFFYLLLLIPIGAIGIGIFIYCKRRVTDSYEDVSISHKNPVNRPPSWVFSEPQYEDEEVLTLDGDHKSH